MKKVNFLGMDVNVMEDDDDVIDVGRQSVADGGPRIYLMPRVADMLPCDDWPELMARRRKRPCPSCGEMCWIDPESYGPVKALKPELICKPCFSARGLKTERMHFYSTQAGAEAIYRGTMGRLHDGGA